MCVYILMRVCVCVYIYMYTGDGWASDVARPLFVAEDQCAGGGENTLESR